MFAPIYLPEADAVSPAVLAAEASIVERDGLHYVGERYFLSQADCATVRRLEAERIVKANLRASARLPECVYCLHPIEANEETVTLAGAVLHRECARMHDEFMNCGLDDQVRVLRRAGSVNVAKSVRLKKEARPQDYCADRKCLWNVVRSGPCPRHPVGHEKPKMSPEREASIRAGIRALDESLERDNSRPVPYVFASDCCPVCFSQRGGHVKGCPRAATAEDIERILDERLGKASEPEAHNFTKEQQ